MARWAIALTAALTLTSLLGSCAGERPTLGRAVAEAEAVAPTTTTTSTTTTTTTTTSSAPSTTTVATTSPATAPPTAPSSAPPVNSDDAPRPLGPDDLLGFIATPQGQPVVRRTPDQAGTPIEVGPTTAFGAPTTFAVIGDPTRDDAAWLRVLLPSRPNGADGWVPRSSVTITRTTLRVFIDRSARSLRVQRDGKEVLSTTTAIGTSTNPTPAGASYVTELIDNNQPTGAYGPYAFGLALHSDTLSEFGGGDGQVGIHGTNQPQLIGQAVSHGCVRLTNADVERLVGLQLPLGVPVFIS